MIYTVWESWKRQAYSTIFYTQFLFGFTNFDRDWLNECCITSIGRYFMHIQHINERWWINLALNKTDILNLILNLLTRNFKHQSTGRHATSTQDTLFWLWANKSLLSPLYSVWLVENQQIPNLMSLVWSPRIKPTTLYKQGKHANHYDHYTI